MITLINGDCLTEMQKIPDKSIDLILCDLPYGTTACKWDVVIPLDKLWGQYERIIKDNGAIVLFASGSFTHKLICSNESRYRYKWIWVKSRKGNFVNAKNRPMTSFEEILVFSKGVTANGAKNKMKYYPQGLKPVSLVKNNGASKFGTMAAKRKSHKDRTVQEFTNYPFDVLNFDSEPRPVHPTQKPLALLEYLIRTYTNEQDTVLDNTMGSGSTMVACVNTNRNGIGIELNEEYFRISQKRVNESTDITNDPLY